MRIPSSLALVLALSGCFYVNDGRFAREVEDADGDGGIGTRFGGPDCADDDPSVADCDVDGDGYLTADAGGDDCDDQDASAVPGTVWFVDEDGDGYGQIEGSTTGCGTPPSGWSTSGGDCDDADDAISPNALETCDAIDRNCDGDAFATSEDGTVTVWPDADGDTFGEDHATPSLVCEGATGGAVRQGDCDDRTADVSPDAAEVPYDGVDQDCDASNEWDADLDGEDAVAYGGADCDDTNAEVSPGGTEACDGLDNDCDGLVDGDDPSLPTGQLATFYADVDGDGFGGASKELACAGAAPDGYTLTSTDCDDGAEAVHPGAVEWCNLRDDDCNKIADEGTAVDAFPAYFDNDQDGYGKQGVTLCDLSPFDYDKDGKLDIFVLRSGDCSDTDPSVHPGAPEVCGDPVRQDCSTFDADDCDNDGYRAKASLDADCNDDPTAGGATVSPGQQEVCDGLDNDCDGKFDSADPDVLPMNYPDWYFDFDGDGHGADFLAASSTCDPPGLAAPNDDDCDDFNPFAYPGSPESCDGNDNDCDGLSDEDAIDTVLLFEDQDHDGYGSIYVENRCLGDDDFSPQTGDCDDQDATVAPDATEICDDAVDNNCNGLVDAADPSAATDSLWYPDDDDDGIGLSPGLLTCGDPSTVGQSYVSAGGDCDDADALQKGPAIWFADLDKDKHSGTQTIEFGCRPGSSWSLVADDCNDASPTIFPGAQDGCNFRDDDCDGTFDEAPLATDPGAAKYFSDLDGDTYGAGTSLGYTCHQPPIGASWVSDDCDDNDPDSNPNAPEVCNDGYDNDCDPNTTDACPCIGWQWPDVDGDGRGSAIADPTFACTAIGALAPDDCDDTKNSPQGTEYELGPTQASNLVAYVQNPGCTVIRLDEGTYVTDTLIPDAGSLIHIVSKFPTRPATLVSNGGRVIDLANTGSDLTITNVNISGSATAELVRVAFDRLSLTNTTIDGQNTSRGIVADGGTLDLFDVTVKNANSALEGSALSVGKFSELNVNGLNVEDSIGPSSVFIDPGDVNHTLDDLHLYRSAGVRISGSGTNVVQFNRLESWDSVTTTLYAAMPGDLRVDRAVIARSVGNAIEYRGTSGLQVKGATILECQATGIFSSGPVTTVSDSIVLYCIGSFNFAGTAERSRGNGTPTVTDEIPDPIKFVRYSYGLYGTHPGLPGREIWDLHLRADSAGRGFGFQGEDVGGYSKLDPYYRDAQLDDIPDGWATSWFGTSIVGLNDDPDADGVTNDDEYTRGTCPIVADTDQDLVNDKDDNAPLARQAQ